MHIEVNEDKDFFLAENEFKNFSSLIVEEDDSDDVIHCQDGVLSFKDNCLTFVGVNFDGNIFEIHEDGISINSGSFWFEIFLAGDMQYYFKYVKKYRFYGCQFTQDSYFRENLEYLEIHNCRFHKRCYINNQYEGNIRQITLDKLIIKNSLFNHNFKLHNCVINNFDIIDTDFEKNADFFKTHFNAGSKEAEKISFHTINFHELALFGDTIFNKFLEFKYVTFKGYTHFRSAIFYEGLDLEYANIEKEMNFFNIHGLSNNTSKKNTSQETYRIIKHQLQKVGNIIQSNKYQAFELEKRQYNVCNKCSYRSLLDCIVLNIHNISSSHSTNWLLALVWIIIIGITTTYFLEKNININSIIQYMSILNKYDEFKINQTISYTIMMFNKISLGYLYYQFVTAIRKDTRK